MTIERRNDTIVRLPFESMSCLPGIGVRSRHNGLVYKAAFCQGSEAEAIEDLRRYMPNGALGQAVVEYPKGSKNLAIYGPNQDFRCIWIVDQPAKGVTNNG